MSSKPHKPENESSLLAPVIGAYEPTEADADRIFAKVEAVLDAEQGPTPTRRPASLAAKGKATLLVTLSCVAAAIVTTMVFRTSRDVSTAPSSVNPPTIHDGPRGEANVEPKIVTHEAVSIPSVAVTTLPDVAPASTPVQATKRPAASALPASSLPAKPPATDDDTLEKEARILADARSASQNHDGARALALLDEHARAFPHGWLASERDAERVLVLCRMGRQAEATRAAASFLEGRPKGPLTQRVEASCAGPSPTKSTE